ncbi:MAG: YtxH domain-containing protein [Spirochaetes bacterium]|nr:YtxH domain-containing protein [Spirochaetota bacterium]
MSEKNDTFAFLSGVVIGAVLALLFAPKSGRETREDLKKKAGDVLEKGKEKAHDLYEHGKEKAHEIYEHGKVKAGEVYAEGKVKAHELYEKGRHAVEDGIDNVSRKFKKGSAAENE